MSVVASAPAESARAAPVAGKRLRIGLAGLGTVGCGLLKLLADAEASAFPDLARSVEVVGVSARDRARRRPADIESLAWFDDPVALAVSPEVDVLVELIGGAEGPAHAAVRAALERGKPVVTANKALIATHGLELARLAESRGAPLLYEAAVMGGTPAIKLLREGLVADQITAVAGILNGTCNFILTEMEASGRSFADVLAEAQRLGYAEADPRTDVGGFDAAHKISIVAALAFGGAPNLAAAEIEGIDTIETLDMKLAGKLGYRIKLIASANLEGEAASVRVTPALVPLAHPLAQAGGALNALFIEGRHVGRLYLQGAGAGAGPTAVAVAADLADVLSGASRPVFQRAADALQPLAAAEAGRRTGRVFLRLLVRDRPGVLAAVAEALAAAQVSIDSLLQHPSEEGELVPIVLTTHTASERAIEDAVAHIEAIPDVVQRPKVIPLARI